MGLHNLFFDAQRTQKTIMEQAQSLGREFVIQISGTVIERESKNPNMPTGDIEIFSFQGNHPQHLTHSSFYH